ncbi:MAG: molybdate ABC transporter permease subunit [Actinobacteria bacterium]|nr:molybdate ABC transporter permease subunit [Actinomycetota bacterium]
MNTGARPAPVVVLGLAGAGFLALPVVALLVRVPWSDALDVLGAPASRQALGLSLATSLAAAGLSVTFGVPLAWLLAGGDGRVAAFGRAVVLLPIVLPPVVGGVALLAALGRRGVAGSWLAQAGVVLPFSAAGVVAAQVFVAMPFLVVTVEAALRSTDARSSDAAASLGAGGWRTFRQVTLPSVAPALLAGVALAWARALGEFGATITFAGNLQGRTQTLPLAVYLGTQTDPGAALVLSALLVAVSLVVLVVLRSRWVVAFRPTVPARGPRTG